MLIWLIKFLRYVLSRQLKERVFSINPTREHSDKVVYLNSLPGLRYLWAGGLWACGRMSHEG